MKNNNHHFNEFQQGHEQSLTNLYGSLYRRIKGYGMRIVCDEFVVNTITQEAFLKLWAFRERMTSMDHVVRFLKLTMRWECMAYYRNHMETLYRKAVRMDWVEWIEVDLSEPDDDEDITVSENRLRLLSAMIPQLPSQRQRMVMSLFAKEGMTVSQIGARLHCSTKAISDELQHCKTLLRALAQPVKRSFKASRSSKTAMLRPIPGLSDEALQIISLRRDMKYSFAQISGLLKLPLEHVQNQYIEGCRKAGDKLRHRPVTEQV